MTWCFLSGQFILRTFLNPQKVKVALVSNCPPSRLFFYIHPGLWDICLFQASLTIIVQDQGRIDILSQSLEYTGARQFLSWLCRNTYGRIYMIFCILDLKILFSSFLMTRRTKLINRNHITFKITTVFVQFLG